MADDESEVIVMNNQLLKKLSLTKFKIERSTKEMLGKAMNSVVATLAAAGLVSPTYCDSTDVTTVGNNVIKAVFNVLLLGGIVLAAVGVVQLVRAIMEASQGQSQPGAVGKALGMILGGIVMAAAKTVLNALGVQTDGWSLTGG